METNGSSLLEQTQAGQQLQQQLTNEKTLTAINHLLDRIDTLENAVEKLSTIMQQAPGMLSMATDIADEEIAKAHAKGIDFSERMGNALALAEKMTEAKNLEKIENLLAMSDQAPGLLAMGIDIIDEEIRKAQQSGIEFPRMAEFSKTIALAISKTKDQPSAKVNGIWSLVRALKDPDRQKAINYLMDLAKAFGREL